ncbi:B12-binding domain-containing radical SAM protein, partial [Candidatus Kuenenbacteria bacterium CG23_combo_of_CG06-09_8_20_14_all_39_39]
GKCTFCSWANTLFPDNCYRTRKVENVLDEIGSLIKLGVKEIMDDSGTFPIGDWLTEFCQGMIERGYNKKVKISCNMRLNAIKDLKIYQLMKQAGFRMILFGLESANQKTLDKLNKGLRADEIEPCLKICKKAGLEPHITVMVGYPWETKSDAQKTLDLAKKLFRNGIVDSLQATIMIPYPGTELYKYCQENNLLNTLNYDNFDQSQQVMRTQLSDAEIKKMIRALYRSFLTPKFFLNKIKSVRSTADIKFYLKAGLKVIGHLGDFKKSKKLKVYEKEM